MMTVQEAPVTQPAFALDSWVRAHLDQVERALERWISANALQDSGHAAPVALVDAMRYSVLDGGKRLRPLLVLAAYEPLTAEPSGPARRPCVQPVPLN